MEHMWLTHAKRLQALASTGLSFSRDEYDIERYREIGDIANELLALLADVPVARIEGLVSEFAKGYATPRIDVRGALFEGHRVLLIQERSDGRWSLPGGFADVGASPSENIIKEMWEEAGLRVTATALYSVRHKAKHEYASDARDFYKLFFLCDRLDDEPLNPGPEVRDAAYFAVEDLPPLSTDRVLRDDIEEALRFRMHPDAPASFD